jgi:hypothetical protein
LENCNPEVPNASLERCLIEGSDHRAAFKAGCIWKSATAAAQMRLILNVMIILLISAFVISMPASAETLPKQRSCYLPPRKLKDMLTTTAILTIPAFVGLTDAAPVIEIPVASLSARISAFHASLVGLNVWSGNRKNESCKGLIG